jgi:hypothetical protein
MTSERDKGWLEGILDGEGSLYITKNSKNRVTPVYQPHVIIVNTSHALLERVKKIVGGGNILPKRSQFMYYKNVVYETKDSETYYMSREDMIRVLPNITLTVKEPNRILLLDAIELLEKSKWKRNAAVLAELEVLYQESRFLNRKGKEVEVSQIGV